MGIIDSKKKYILIDSRDLKRPVYNMEREYSFNDYDNVYYKRGDISLENLFYINEIPKEFQKIVFAITSPLIICNVEDYIAKKPFVTRVHKLDNSNIIIIDGCTLSLDMHDNVNFLAYLEFCSMKEVKDYYQKIKDAGFWEIYKKTIKHFYQMSTKIEKSDENGVQFVKELKVKKGV